MSYQTGKVSVIMGIYNCAGTLPDAIDAILDQTYSNWELIMCDDASTDETYEVALSYVKKYPEKMKLVRNNTNSRLAYSLNRCLQYASGEFIARMDGDDKCVPERFEKQVDFLRKNPQYDLVGSNMQRFNENGLADIVHSIEAPDRYSLRKSSVFNHATIMTYKRVYEKLGGYTVAERTKRAQDYDLWFRFFYHGFNGYNIQEALYYVREDVNALKRRTFKVRWNAFKTTVYGYRLLNYPTVWLLEAAAWMMIKSITPWPVVLMYRKWQARNKKSS